LAVTFAECLLNSLLETIERSYERGLRLRAYRRRHEWRKADLWRLLDLGVTPAAQRRLARLQFDKSPGRGVIPPYKSLSAVTWEVWDLARALWDPATSAAQRMAAYKKTTWFPHFVEATIVEII
jgi:hypothetical protein